MPRKCMHVFENGNRCEKRPSFGYDKPLYCKSHKQDNMASVSQKKCIVCKQKQPNFGNDGTSTHCGDCKLEDMININKQRTLCAGCNKKQPTYGINSSTHCKDCKSDDMENIANRNKICIICETKRCSFGLELGKATHCKDCKEEEMVNVVTKRCIECNKRYRSYGYEIGKSTHCGDCKLEDMINVVTKRCRECKQKFPTYGYAIMSDLSVPALMQTLCHRVDMRRGEVIINGRGKSESELSSVIGLSIGAGYRRVIILYNNRLPSLSWLVSYETHEGVVYTTRTTSKDDVYSVYMGGLEGLKVDSVARQVKLPRDQMSYSMEPQAQGKEHFGLVGVKGAGKSTITNSPTITSLLLPSYPTSDIKYSPSFAKGETIFSLEDRIRMACKAYGNVNHKFERDGDTARVELDRYDTVLARNVIECAKLDKSLEELEVIYPDPEPSKPANALEAIGNSIGTAQACMVYRRSAT